MKVNADPTTLSLVARCAGVICAQIDGEFVALNVEKGVCYGLDPIGSHIWTLIEQPISFNTLCAALEARYRVDHATCERDVGDLLRDLRSEGLVTLDPAPSPASEA